MMATGLAAVVMMVMVSGEVTVGDSNWREACTGQVCTVAEKQAEGLARLRVLSNYVKETMSLMNSVVSSLDDEMLVVGQELRSVVGRRCHARGPSALTALITHMNHTESHGNEEGIVEVISDDSDDSWTSSSDLTQGLTSTWSSNVDVLMGSSPSISHSTWHRPSSSSTSQRPSSTSQSTTYHDISQGPSSETDSTSQGISHHPSSTSHRTSQHPSSVSQISTTSSSTSHSSSSTASRATGKTLHHRPSSTLKKYEGQPSAPAESVYVAPVQPEEDSSRNTYTGITGNKRPVGRGQGRGKGNAWGRGQDGARGQGRGRGQVALGSLGSDTFELCRGVPIGSPYYVPGLDDWCANNCPRMCPATHCICSTP